MKIIKVTNEKIVGENIGYDDITDFYWTYDSSAYPPEFQRYRFFVDEDGHHFYHETREGDHWPLTEEDITVSGTTKLSDEEWGNFLEYMKDGSVTERGEDLRDGDSGPWTFLYWKNDRNKYQVFTFASFDAGKSFEELCKRLKK